MSAIEIVISLVGISALVLGIIVAGQALERRAAQKLASCLLGQPCPVCGWSFRREAICSARLEHAFDGPDSASIICPDCSRRWLLSEGRLIEKPL